MQGGERLFRKYKKYNGGGLCSKYIMYVHETVNRQIGAGTTLSI